MKLYTQNPQYWSTGTVRVAGLLAGQKLQVSVVDADFKTTAEWKSLNSTDGFPILQTPEGNI